MSSKKFFNLSSLHLGAKFVAVLVAHAVFRNNHFHHESLYYSGLDEYVSDPSAELTSRIDLIFVDPKDMFIIKTKCEVVGNDVSDMIPNPIDPDTLKLWPSDHAGVVAEIQFLKMPPQSRKPGVQ